MRDIVDIAHTDGWCGKLGEMIMKPAVIDRTQGEWIDVHDVDIPRDDNGYPFWVTVEDDNGMRRRELVAMTAHDGLCFTTNVYGDDFLDTVTERVTHWMPLNIPMYPAK